VAHQPHMEDRKHESAESRMSRGIAPIKQEYIKIISKDYRESIQAAASDVKQAGQDSSKASKVAAERKSRRAFKKVCRPMTPTCVELRFTSGPSIHASKCPVLSSHAFHWQEARQKREASVCSRFVRGICPFGDNCKFSHDVDAYLASKPADLPGQCPYTASPECPYGESSLEHCTLAQNPVPEYHRPVYNFG
jgi:hypothetical protein